MIRGMATTQRRLDRGIDQADRVNAITGSEVRLSRRGAGVSIRTAAASVGMSETMFGRIERGACRTRPFANSRSLVPPSGSSSLRGRISTAIRSGTQVTLGSSSGFIASFPRAPIGGPRSRSPAAATLVPGMRNAGSGE